MRVVPCLAVGLILVAALAATASAERRSSTEARCSAGKVRTESTHGRCCWPGQEWSKRQRKCVGGFDDPDAIMQEVEGGVVRRDEKRPALPTETESSGDGSDSSRPVRGKMKRGRSSAVAGTGALSNAAVVRTLDKVRHGILACYEWALRSDPTLKGRITVRFTIGKTGRVATASAPHNQLGPDVGACIVGRIRELQFPPPEGGSVTFSSPFFFQPQ